MEVLLVEIYPLKKWNFSSRAFYSVRSSIKYGRKIFRKTNISNLLIRTRTCAYLGIKNVSFPGNFSYVLNGWSLTTNSAWLDELLISNFIISEKYEMKLNLNNIIIYCKGYE